MADEAAHDLENDVCFILTSAFLIFTMQTGYALLESGIVSRKNEVNILLKSAVNIICGSCAFWIYGFAFSSRHVAEDNQLTMQRRSNENHDDDDSEVAQFFTKHVFNSDRFFVNVPTIDAKADDISYVDFAFQLAYATTCTAIISGAVAERFKFIAYFLFCLFNGFLFTLPSRWIMYPGWLNAHGVIDIGGSGTVHLTGGVAGLIAAIFVGPRLGRFAGSHFRRVPMGNPTNALHGLILLWWGWLGYTAGSSFGVANDKWKYSARASVVTALASMGGGAFGMSWSALTRSGLQDIEILVDSILASLVAISGGAPIITPVFSVIIGVVGAFLALITIPILERFKIDDPTNSFAVHAVSGAWGMIAIGLFADAESMVHYHSHYNHNPNWKVENFRSTLVVSQLIAIAVLIIWSSIVSIILLLILHYTVGLRIGTQEEILGPDYVEHGLNHDGNQQLLKVIQQKIVKVNSGYSDSVASAEAVARLSTTRSKRSLTAVHSPNLWASSTAWLPPAQPRNWRQKQNSMFSLQTVLNASKRKNTRHPVWTTGTSLTRTGTHLQKYLHKSSTEMQLPSVSAVPQVEID